MWANSIRRRLCLVVGLIGIALSKASYGGEISDYIIPVTDKNYLAKFPQGFVSLGPVYLIVDPAEEERPFFLSSGMDDIYYYQAERLCEMLGGESKLPTNWQFKALIRAMTHDKIFYPYAIPGTRHPNGQDRWFWSGDTYGIDSDKAYVFLSTAQYGGYVTDVPRYNTGSARCTFPASADDYWTLFVKMSAPSKRW